MKQRRTPVMGDKGERDVERKKFVHRKGHGAGRVSRLNSETILALRSLRTMPMIVVYIRNVSKVEKKKICLKDT